MHGMLIQCGNTHLSHNLLKKIEKYNFIVSSDSSLSLSHRYALKIYNVLQGVRGSGYVEMGQWLVKGIPFFLLFSFFLSSFFLPSFGREECSFCFHVVFDSCLVTSHWDLGKWLIFTMCYLDLGWYRLINKPLRLR